MMIQILIKLKIKFKMEKDVKLLDILKLIKFLKIIIFQDMPQVRNYYKFIIIKYLKRI